MPRKKALKVGEDEVDARQRIEALYDRKVVSIRLHEEET